MSEQRKQDVAREYIENNNIEYIWKELNDFKEEINSSLIDVKSILWSEKVWEEDNELKGINMLWINGVMGVLFRKDWKQRRKLWYEILKSAFIKEESKQKLDLLFLALKKSKTEEELRNNLREELNKLENNIQNNIDNWNNINQPNIWWYENLSWIENKEQHQVSEQYIYKQAEHYWVTDKRHIAYILAIVKWECWFKNIKEIWWENRSYWWIDPSTWKAYYGRWFLQLTHKSNYEKYTKIIKESWFNFKDNDWNLLTWDKLDLVKNPDTVLESNDLASFILIDWMKNWWPYRQDEKKLSHYINNDKTDFFNARYIINWDKNYERNWKRIWDMYKEYAEDYLNKIWRGRNINIKIDNNPNNILIDGSPELLATNNTEIWWLWNSMMVGFQSRNIIKFPNMDWVVWMSTQTHPRRFKSKEDIIDYKNNHQNIKSFMFYFWANTTNNKQTLSDIKNRSEWMQEVWIQPVLCTCIWEDNHPHLTDLNRQIIEMWKENNWPVLDFAKEYNNWQITMWNNLHPDGDWYTAMAGMIKDCVVQQA